MEVSTLKTVFSHLPVFSVPLGGEDLKTQVWWEFLWQETGHSRFLGWDAHITKSTLPMNTHYILGTCTNIKWSCRDKMSLKNPQNIWKYTIKCVVHFRKIYKVLSYKEKTNTINEVGQIIPRHALLCSPNSGNLCRSLELGHHNEA